jgi:hypothetical protein
MSGPVGAGQPMGGRVMSTGTCIALIAVGAILRFAVTAQRTHGVNVHVVGVIVLLAGVLGLLLSLLVWSPLNPNRRRTSRPTGYDSGPPPPAAPQYRTFRDEPPPSVREQRIYQDEPPR